MPEGTASNQIFDQIIVDTAQAEAAYNKVAQLRKNYVDQANKGPSATMAGPAATTSAGNTAATAQLNARKAQVNQAIAQETLANVAGQKAQTTGEFTEAQKRKQIREASQRDVRGQAMQLRRDISESQSVGGFGRGLVEKMMGSEQDMIKVRLVAEEMSKLMAAGQVAGQSDDVTRALPQYQALQGQLDGMKSKYGGLKGLARAFTSEFIQSAVAMSMIVPEMAIIQGVMEQVGFAIDGLIHKTKDYTQALHDVASAASKKGSAVAWAASIGLGDDQAAIGAATYASKLQVINDKLKDRIALMHLGGFGVNTSSGGDKNAPVSEDISARVDEVMKGFAYGGPLGGVGDLMLGNFPQKPISSITNEDLATFAPKVGTNAQRGEIFANAYDFAKYDKGLPKLAALREAWTALANAEVKAELASPTADKMTPSQGLAAIKEVSAETGTSKWEDLTKKWANDDWTRGWQRMSTLAGEAVSRLSQGKPILDTQKAALEGINGALATRLEMEGQALFALQNQAQVEERQHTTNQYDRDHNMLLREIGIAQGKITVGADAELHTLDLQSHALQLQSQELEKHQHFLERARSIALETTNLARAGIAGSGDSAADVMANIAEAQAQNKISGQDRGYQDAQYGIQQAQTNLDNRRYTTEQANTMRELNLQRTQMEGDRAWALHQQTTQDEVTARTNQLGDTASAMNLAMSDWQTDMSKNADAVKAWTDTLQKAPTGDEIKAFVGSLFGVGAPGAGTPVAPSSNTPDLSAYIFIPGEGLKKFVVSTIADSNRSTRYGALGGP